MQISSKVCVYHSHTYAITCSPHSRPALAQVLLVFGGENDDSGAGASTGPPPSSSSASRGAAAAGEAGSDPADPFSLACFDTDLMLWYAPTVTGRAPQPRSGHSLSLLPAASGSVSGTGGDGKVVVLFGGIRRRQWLNDIYTLRTDTFRWLAVRPAGTPPHPRSYHAAATVPASPFAPSSGPRLVVFGGNDGNRSFADVHVLECG